MKSLAIEREFGSGGREIGMKVAKAAGIPYYDGELLVKAAESYGLSVAMLKEYDEKRTGSFLFDIASFADAYQQRPGKKSVPELLYTIQKTIENIEMQGPAVFIGRCSTEILKKNPHVTSAYIYSSDEAKKLRRIVETEDVANEAEARRLMDKMDKQRRLSFKYWSQKNWSDRANYDMELNTGTLSIEKCVDILLAAIGK